MPFSAHERAAWFQGLTANPPELLILGGGAAGASIAAHAAALGLNVVLIERADLASGASGNSTGLAHAGLRYLAQGKLGYVFRESRERQHLEELAPHWVRPFNFIFPVYARDPYSLGKVAFGTWIYDLCTWIDCVRRGKCWPPRHQRLTPDELTGRVPGLRTDGLIGGVEYFVDARLQDSRFTLGWAQRAARDGARIITYAEVSGLEKDASTTQQLRCKDLLTGNVQEFLTPLVINATGAWIDEVRRTAGIAAASVQPSRGIHLVVDQIVSSPLIFSTEIRDKVFFVIPAGHDRSIVGTTDVPQRGSPDGARPDEKEIGDLIRRVFQFFPYLKQGSTLSEAMALYREVHVRDVYWGLRPLVAQQAAAERASREHALVCDSLTFWSIPGVKLTAARGVGEEVATAAWRALRREPAPAVPSSPLPGGEIQDFRRFVDESRLRFKLDGQSDELVPYLVSMYGTRYVDVLKWVDQEPHYREPVLDGEPWLPAEAAHAAREEMVVRLNDFLWRRTKWAHYRDLPAASLHKLVNVLSEALGWEPDRTEQELRSYQDELKRHRIT